MPLLNAADAIYLGARAVDRVYLGANQVWPPSGGGGTLVRFGNETLPAFHDVDLNGEDGRAFLTRFQAPASGTLQRIAIYSNSASALGVVKGICYADAAGVPGALVAVGAEVNTVASGAYYDSPCAGQAIVSGAWYWLGGLHKDFHSVMRANNSSGTGWAAFGGIGYATPEDPLVSGFAIGYNCGVYAEILAP